jgi:outer membrane lipoprotein-sorting protein
MRSLLVPAVVVSLLALAAPAAAQTADEIIAKHLQAKGGVEKWKSISSVKMTGKLTAQGKDLPTTVYTKRPNLLRQDITTPGGPVVQAFDGTTPWMIAPGSEAAREITGPQADAARSGADFDGPLMDYAAKGHKAELVGKEKVGTADVYHIRLTKKDGGVEDFFMDVNTGLEVKRAMEMNAGGVKQRLESELSNYKTVDGMMIPHTLTQSVNGAPVMQMTIEKIEFNPPMDDALFRMPKK